MELIQRGSSMMTFSSIMGTKAAIFTPNCSTESDYFMRAWGGIQDKKYGEFCSVIFADRRWRILFISVPLSGKLPEVAESSRLHLPSIKQKGSLCMHTGQLAACKTRYLTEDLIMLLVLANFLISSYEKKAQD